MNYLEKLLDGTQVKWKYLWEVTTWDKKFNAVNKFKQPKVIKYNYFLSKEINSLISKSGTVKLLTTNITDLHTTEELAGNKIAESEIVAIPGGGNPVVHYYKGKFLTSDNRIATSNDTSYLDNKYLYYFLLNNLKIISSFYRGSGIKHPSMSAVLDMQIPVPSIKTQKEIVRILDAFTELTSELAVELNARKKQYEYYRDKLLTFSDDEVEWKTLGDVGKLVRGNGLPKTDFRESGVPAIHYGQIYTYYGLSTTSTISFVSSDTANNLKKVDTGDVIITNTSENFEDLGKSLVYLGSQQAVTGGHATILKPSAVIIGKYFAYFTQTAAFAIEKQKYAKGTKVIDISARDLSKILIPVPSMEEQARIVAILDKFDALTNSLQEGLPREIELRKKQYEYYRDMLFNFPKPEAIFFK